MAQRLPALRNWTLSWHYIRLDGANAHQGLIFTVVLERNSSSPGERVQEGSDVSIRIYRNLHSVLKVPDIDFIGTPNMNSRGA